MTFISKTLRSGSLAGLTCALLATPVASQGFQEGIIATKRSEGDWSYAFSFVNCDGKLRLGFSADKRLNKIRKKTSDGGLFVKFNKNQYQMTFYPDGRAKKRDGTFTEWVYPTAAQMAAAGVPADAFATIKAKCR